MPLIRCVDCDRLTNTATAMYDEAYPNVAKGCYAAFVDNKWVKGCAYDKIRLLATKISIDKLIGQGK